MPENKNIGQAGSSLTEFALLVALIAVVSIASVLTYGEAVDDYFERNALALELGETDSGDSGGSGHDRPRRPDPFGGTNNGSAGDGHDCPTCNDRP